MTQLGKVLKGLKCCKGDLPITYKADVSKRGCADCPYAEIDGNWTTNDVISVKCHHKDLMQDAYDILVSYARTNINQKQQIKAHQDWIDSWSDSNYL